MSTVTYSSVYRGYQTSFDNYRRPSIGRSCYEHQNPSTEDTPLPLSLPQPPANESPPKPPDRPPKRPIHRTAFQPPKLQSSSSSTPSPTDNSDMRRIEESANELRNLSQPTAPNKPYYYRKPPAPDPPKTPSPPSSPSPSPAVKETSSSSNNSNSLFPPHQSTSRSSTPDLPPPPPPPVIDEEVLTNDDPLPPPPEEVVPPPPSLVADSSSAIPREDADVEMEFPPSADGQPNGTYHKDSYMAHRRDWKTGFEGRYRRTHSPTLTRRQNQMMHPLSSQPSPLTEMNGVANIQQQQQQHGNTASSRHHRSNANNLNNNINANIASSTGAKNVKNGKHSHSVNVPSTRGILRSAVSTSSLSHPSLTPLDNHGLMNGHNANHSINASQNNVNNNNTNMNNDYLHPRQNSTTVDFTSDELHALKSRRPSTHESSIELRQQDSDYRRDQWKSRNLGEAQNNIDNDHSQHFWRTSLDCLHNSHIKQDERLRTMSRAFSVGEPLHSLAELAGNGRDYQDCGRLSEHSSAERFSEASEKLSESSSGRYSEGSLAEKSELSSEASGRFSRSASIDDTLNRSIGGNEPIFTSSAASISSSSLSSIGAPKCADPQSSPSSRKSSPISIQTITPTTMMHSPLSNGSMNATSTPLSSPTSPISHDGPITAHPAKVTEESFDKSFGADSNSSSSLPPTSMSESYFGQSSLVTHKTSVPNSPVRISPLSSSNSNSTLVQNLSSPPLLTSSPKSSAILPPPVSGPLLFSQTSHASLTSLLSQPSFVSQTSHDNSRCYLRSLSSTGTSPSTACLNNDEEQIEQFSNAKDIIALSYGRCANPTEIECRNLMSEFASRISADHSLKRLIAPEPSFKTTANYMYGIFNLELRRDLLCDSHAKHPDIKADLQRIESPNNAVSQDVNPQNVHHPVVNGETDVHKTAALRSDLDTTHQRKLKLDGSCITDSQYLKKKKDELLSSVNRKLKILRGEQSAILEETRSNSELGSNVTSLIEMKAKASEIEKFKLHVGEIHKITSLLLGLCGRLAKAENAVLSLRIEGKEEEKDVLISKRDRLSEQLEEAKKLKENIDRRAIQVSKSLSVHLSEVEYADFDHFIKMKTKLIMDAKEVDDKIKLGEEQIRALEQSLPTSS